jgi:hypothetical protein
MQEMPPGYSSSLPTTSSSAEFPAPLNPPDALSGSFPFTPQPVVLLISRRSKLEDLLRSYRLRVFKVSAGKFETSAPSLAELAKVRADAVTRCPWYHWPDITGNSRNIRPAFTLKELTPRFRESSEQSARGNKEQRVDVSVPAVRAVSDLHGPDEALRARSRRDTTTSSPVMNVCPTFADYREHRSQAVCPRVRNSVGSEHDLSPESVPSFDRRLNISSASRTHFGSAHRTNTETPTRCNTANVLVTFRADMDLYRVM